MNRIVIYLKVFIMGILLCILLFIFVNIFAVYLKSMLIFSIIYLLSLALLAIYAHNNISFDGIHNALHQSSKKIFWKTIIRRYGDEIVAQNVRTDGSEYLSVLLLVLSVVPAFIFGGIPFFFKQYIFYSKFNGFSILNPEYRSLVFNFTIPSYEPHWLYAEMIASFLIGFICTWSFMPLIFSILQKLICISFVIISIVSVCYGIYWCFT